MVSINDLKEVLHGLLKESIIGPIKFKMAEIRILKIVQSPYLSKKNHPISMTFGVHLELDDSQATEYNFFYIQDGGRLPF